VRVRLCILIYNVIIGTYNLQAILQDVCSYYYYYYYIPAVCICLHSFLSNPLVLRPAAPTYNIVILAASFYFRSSRFRFHSTYLYIYYIYVVGRLFVRLLYSYLPKSANNLILLTAVDVSFFGKFLDYPNPYLSRVCVYTRKWPV